MLGTDELGIQLAHLLLAMLVSVSSVYWRKEAEVEYTPALMAQLLLLVTHFTLGNRANQNRLRMDSSSVVVHLARLPFHFFLNDTYVIYSILSNYSRR